MSMRRPVLKILDGHRTLHYCHAPDCYAVVIYQREWPEESCVVVREMGLCKGYQAYWVPAPARVLPPEVYE